MAIRRLLPLTLLTATLSYPTYKYGPDVAHNLDQKYHKFRLDHDIDYKTTLYHLNKLQSVDDKLLEKLTYKHPMLLNNEITDSIREKIILECNVFLFHLKTQPSELCWKLLEKDPYNIQYIRDQTEDMCMYVTSQDPNSLWFCKIQTEDVCKNAISKAPWTIKYVKNQTFDIAYFAYQLDNSLINDTYYYDSTFADDEEYTGSLTVYIHDNMKEAIRRYEQSRVMEKN